MRGRDHPSEGYSGFGRGRGCTVPAEVPVVAWDPARGVFLVPGDSFAQLGDPPMPVVRWFPYGRVGHAGRRLAGRLGELAAAVAVALTWLRDMHPDAPPSPVEGELWS